ncbi:MAG: SUMF1/EgtB/PvdO family nonheme iron enzyme [Myxococcales bacterium]|nr:SUMF1/EgtB/PvdO family nonheme iron enzyme [Myxococcales bacterium]
MRAAAFAVVGLVSCSSQPQDLPPYGEALIVVDTDIPVPALANRLRLDLYSADGSQWLSSRDVALRDARDWPTSFSVYTPDTVHDRVTLVRLRAYFEGRARDYHGERFVSSTFTGAPTDLASPVPDCAKPAECELPRLVVDGVDATPRSEPQPAFAVDRLLRLHLVPGTRGRVHVVLRGSCIGTMADLAGARSCLDTAGLVPVTEPVALAPEMTIPSPIEKSFGAPTPCPSTASPRPGRKRTGGGSMYDEEVCVPGGTFAFGGWDGRLAVVPPFYIDKYEVTVGRWREFKPPSAAMTPKANTSKLELDTCKVVLSTSDQWCSWTTAAGVPENRENHAVTCVSWAGARAFCQSLGGDLPTEAQWEWAAQHAARPARTEYPWGDAPPTCLGPKGGEDRAIIGRMDSCSLQNFYYDLCVAGSGSSCGKVLSVCGTKSVFNPRQGPQPVDAVARVSGDWSVELGIVNLFGGVSEYTLDAFASLRSNCWAAAPLVSPVCADDAASRHTIRGANWVGGDFNRHVNDTVFSSGNAPSQIGFRCVRPLEAR